MRIKVMKKLVKKKGTGKETLKKEEGQKIMTVCEKLGKICQSERRLVEKKKREAYKRLGAELWLLYREKADDIFAQKKIMDILKEIERYEVDLDKIHVDKGSRGKEEEHRTMMKDAIKNLTNNDSRIRKASIRIIERLSAKEAIPQLIGLLDDPDETIRAQAAFLMHQLVNKAEKQKVVKPDKTKKSTTENASADKKPQQKKKKRGRKKI